MSKGTDGGRGKIETAKTRLPRGGKAGVAAFERGLTRAREKVGFKQVIESCNLAELQPSPSREDLLAEREKLAPLLPADRPQPAPDARKVVIRKLEVREAGYRGPETARPTKEQIARARAIGYDITAPEAPATNSQVIVENYGETSHSPPDMGHLHEYLKTLGVPESRLPEVAADVHAHALKLVKGEVTGRAAPVAAPVPFAEALEAMTLKDRRAALAKHYAAVKKNTWTKARGDDRATPEKFLAWLDGVFPDRREIGMALSDLQHLDKPAYEKVFNWSRPNSGVSKAEIDSFGLPSKATKYDPVRDASAPASFAEVVERAERGEGSFRELNRAYGRTRYHERVI